MDVTAPMAAFSVAQNLPFNVLEQVLNYMSPERIDVPWTRKNKRACTLRRLLVPLLGVCRAWRDCVCRVFYRAAAIDTREEPYFGHLPSVEMQGAIDNRAWHYVRSLTIHISMSIFSETPPGEPFGFADALSEYGDLSSVRSITFDLHSRHSASPPTANSNNDPSRASENIAVFTQHILGAMPRINSVRFAKNIFARYDDLPDDISLLLQSLCAALYTNLRHLSLTCPGLYLKPTMFSDQATALQSICFIYRMHPADIELVRSSAQSLQKVHIDAVYWNLLPMLTGGDDGKASLVYPQLKHMYIKVTGALGKPAPESCHASVDLFPQLETMVIKDGFPYSDSVLIGGYSHIRHLDICLTLEQLKKLRDGGILKKGAFAHLCYIMLDLRYDDSASPNFTSIYVLMTELSNKLQVVRFRNMRKGGYSSSIIEVELPKTLRVLDLGAWHITHLEAILLIRSCPSLQKVYLSLHEGGKDRLDYSKEALVLERKRNHSTPPRIRYIGIEDWCYRKSKGVVDSLVEIAEELSTVSRIRISTCCIDPSFNDVMDEIESRQRLHGYTNFHNVEFFVSRE